MNLVEWRGIPSHLKARGVYTVDKTLMIKVTEKNGRYYTSLSDARYTKGLESPFASTFIVGRIKKHTEPFLPDWTNYESQSLEDYI